MQLCFLKTQKYYKSISIKNLIKHHLCRSADIECIIEMIDGCKNNPENPLTINASEHIPSVFTMSTISSFRSIENKHVVYRDKNCMKIFVNF